MPGPRQYCVSRSHAGWNTTLTLNVAHDKMAKITPKRVLKAKMAQTQGFQVSGWAAMTLSCTRISTVLK